MFAGIDDVTGLGTTSVTLLSTENLAPGTYDFNIVVSHDGTDEVFPATLEILDEAADAITLVGPNAEFTDATPVFTWENNFDGNNFLIEVSTTFDFTDIVLSEEVVGTSYESETLLLEGTYYWRVTSIPQCNEDAIPSGGAEFTVQIVSVNESALSLINAYPNPTEGEITIENGSGLTMNVFSPQGKLVMTKILETELENIDLNVSPGLYFINIGEYSQHILVK